MERALASEGEDAVADDGVAALADCPEPLPGRCTTRVSWLMAAGEVFSGQQGTDPFPGVKSDGYALGQNNGEILHSIDI